jgi:DNA-binding MarR family transcriptional regulator
MVTSGTMTNRIDRLEHRGLVTRQPDPTDRRGVRVRLTSRGKESVDSALADLLEREQELLAALSTRQQEALSGLLRALVVPFESSP